VAVESPPQDAPVLDAALVAADGGLRGWRCDSCHRLVFGVKQICPNCGGRHGRETRLEQRARLETWTRVFGATDYIVGYCLVGDGEDDQEVRVFGPIDVTDEASLEPNQELEIRFKSSQLPNGERLHHYFVPVSAGNEQRR
jgi:uncharacterized OB-fold protein